MATPLQRFWYLLTLLGWKDKALEKLAVYGVTDFKNLTEEKAEALVNGLQEEWNERSKKPRGSVIHYLCVMPNYSYKKQDNTPDYDKINQWCESHLGKPLNKLSLPELVKAVTMVKAWYRRETFKQQ